MFWKLSGKTFALKSALLPKRKQILLLFLFYSDHHFPLLTTHLLVALCCSRKANNPSTNGDDTWDTALTCCIIVWEERGRMERDDERERRETGIVSERGSLKMQEDCHSTQMWLLFPVCIRCLGNTKLIVTAWRGLSVPSSSCLQSMTAVLSLCVHWPTHLFVRVTSVSRSLVPHTVTF